MDELTETLMSLEESLWQEKTRFDNDIMDKTFHVDFFEFGRSGKVYNRIECMSHPCQPIEAKVPLENFNVHNISDTVKLVTYISEVGQERLRANRSSLWVNESGRWQLRFHQGTPI